MTITPNKNLPYILSNQAQKEVTHNDALNDLDALLMASVIDRDLSVPPGSPAEGDVYLVGASPTGAWSGQAGKIAAYFSGWRFKTPTEGWRIWIRDEDKFCVYTGMTWADLPGTLSSDRNQLINGDFEIWQRGNASTSMPAGSNTYLADRWYVNPTGAAVTRQRSTTIPTGARARYSDQITGATSVTTVVIGQRIEATHIGMIKRQVTFSAKINNSTGAAFVPELLLGTPSLADNFGTVTNRLTQTLQSCGDGVWTTVSHTVDISGYTNIDNGLQVDIRFPSGALNTGSKIIRVIECQLEEGPFVTSFARRNFTEEFLRCQRYYYKTFDYTQAPIQNVGNYNGTLICNQVTTGIAADHRFERALPVLMRTSPTVTFFNPVAANAQARQADAGTDCTNTTALGGTNNAVIKCYTTTAAAGVPGQQISVHFTANAEL
jgi:Protein of unknown function (DUF2793)